MENRNEKDYSRLFWKILDFIGISSLKNNRSRRKSKYLRKHRFLIIVLFILINVFWCTIISIRIYTRYNYLFHFLSNLTALASIGLMITSFFSQREKLISARKLILQFPDRFKTKGVYLFIYFILIITFVMPPVVSLVYISVLSMSYREGELSDKGRITMMSRFLWMISGIFVEVTIPAWLNCIIWGIVQSWYEILCSLNTQLESCGRQYITGSSNTERLIMILQRCRVLWKGTRLVKSALSGTLFFMTVMRLVSLFAVASSSALNIDLLENYQKVKIMIYLSSHYSFFVLTVFLANKIPSEMKKILQSSRELYGDLVFRGGSSIDKSVYDALGFFITEETIRLSIGGFVDVRKSLILAACGSLLTYSVLVVQTSKQM